LTFFLLVYLLMVSHILLVFQKSVNIFWSLVGHFLFVISCRFIPLCFSVIVFRVCMLYFTYYLRFTGFVKSIRDDSLDTSGSYL
jgi:hypothetical protein